LENFKIKMKPLERLWELIALEKKDIKAIYFYAILSGLVQLSVPIGVQSIVGFVMGATMVTSIIVLVILVVIGVFFVGLFQMNQMKIIERIQQKIFTETAFSFTETIPRVDLKKMDAYYLPEKVNRFFDTITVQKSISKILLDIPTATIQILFGILLLSLYHPIFIVFGVILVSLLWIVLKLSSTKGLATSLKESNAKYKVVEWMEEMARVVGAFKFSQGSHLNLTKTDENVSEYLNARTEHFKILLFQYKTLILFKVIITAAMLGIGSVLLVNQKLNVGEFIAAEIIILMVMGSVEKLIGSIDSVYDVITSLEKIGTITESPLETEGGFVLEKQSMGMDIILSDVSFQYDVENKALNNISINFPKNSISSISGSDGSGKSTLMKLLGGNYKHFSGSIAFNHVPIGNYTLESLRNNIGLLTQSHELFKGTIWENISMGKASVTPIEIINIAQKLGLEDFLEKLPNGYDTQIYPLGKRHSNTMMRNILLIRAFAGNPSLVLLDEPFAGYDESLQQKIQFGLLHHFKQTTIIICSNQASFANHCQQQIQLKNGSIEFIKRTS
jgi:ATP-binding cassette, subfamily B, bacterial